MVDHIDTWNELRSLLTTFEAQKKQIYLHYQQLVNSVLSRQIVSEREIEAIMDGLLDFCDDGKFLTLYKALCRHIYEDYSKLIILQVTMTPEALRNTIILFIISPNGRFFH